MSLDGHANDGLPNEQDNIARVERAYSISANMILYSARGPCTIYQPDEAPLRIYRLSRLGTSGAGTGIFDGFRYPITEARSPSDPTELALPKGGFGACAVATTAATEHARLAASRHPIHKLRGRVDKGKYRTRGRHSAATVRGTDWTIDDRCDGTLTKVRRGTVKVRDFGLHKTVIVRAGDRYLARASNGR